MLGYEQSLYDYITSLDGKVHSVKTPNEQLLANFFCSSSQFMNNSIPHQVI